MDPKTAVEASLHNHLVNHVVINCSGELTAYPITVILRHHSLFSPQATIIPSKIVKKMIRSGVLC